MTRVSVGPAKRSMPTRPKSWRFASATNMFPGPTSMSTGSMDSLPRAIAPTALHPAEAVDLVRPAEVLGDHDGGVRLALVGRRASRDALHPRDLRGHHAHVGGGDHRVLAAGDVGADAVHRDVLVAEDDAGHRLVLDVAKRRLLDLGEVPDLRLRELDVGPLAGAHPPVAGVDGGPAQAEVRRRPSRRSAPSTRGRPRPRAPRYPQGLPPRSGGPARPRRPWRRRSTRS